MVALPRGAAQQGATTTSLATEGLLSPSGVVEPSVPTRIIPRNEAAQGATTSTLLTRGLYSGTAGTAGAVRVNLVVMWSDRTHTRASRLFKHTTLANVPRTIRVMGFNTRARAHGDRVLRWTTAYVPPYVAPPAGQYRPLTELIELWQSGRMGRQWEIAPASSASAPLTLTRRQLEIAPTANTAGATYGIVRSVRLYDATNRALTVDVPQVLTAAAGTWDAAVAIEADANNKYDIVFARTGSGVLMTFRRRVAGVTTAVVTLPYTASTRYVRLRHNSGAATMQFDTSPDSLTWTTRGTTAATIAPTGVRVVLNAGTFTSTPAPGVFVFGPINGVPRLKEVTDGFDAASINPFVWSVDTTGGGGTATQSLGLLRLSAATGGAASVAARTQTAAYDPRGQRTTVKLTGIPVAGTAGLSLLLGNSTSNALTIRYNATGALIEAVKVVAGVATVVGSVAYSTVLHRWVGIREAAGTIYFDTSPDGVSWTRFASTAAPFALVGYGARLYADVATSVGNTGTAVFDAFNLTPTKPGTRIRTATGQRFSLRLFEPLGSADEGKPLADMDINPDIVALSWSHKLPGGPNGLTVGLDDPANRHLYGASRGYLPEGIRMKAFAHVELWANGMLVWDGRIRKIGGPEGSDRAFVAEGYAIAGMSDFPYQNTSTALTTSGAIFRDAIQTAAPTITIGDDEDFIDPLTEHAPVEYHNLYPAAIATQLTQEGGTANVLWDFYLKPGRIACFRPRTSTAPDYRIPITDDTPVIRDYGNAYGGAVVTYTKDNVGFETAVGTSDDFVGEYGISRIAVITADETSDAGALQLRDTAIKTRAVPTVSVAKVLQLNDWIATTSGADVPPWTLLAGETIQIGNLAPVPIVQITINGKTGQVQLGLGDAAPSDWNAYVADLRRRSAMLSQNLNPVTGGRKGSITQQAPVAAVTDSTGGSVGSAIAALGGTYDAAALNSAFATILDRVNGLRDALHKSKIIG